MKLGFYLENKQIPAVDLSRPALGNPGCGGTEYLFAATPYYLAISKNTAFTPVIFANHTDKLPEDIDTIQADDIYDAARKAKENGCDVFIYRPRRNQEQDILTLANTLELPLIGWAHIPPKSSYVREMARAPYFKALVCVEHEQYDQLQDSPLSACGKLTFIVNGFDVQNFQLENPPEKDPKLVAYLGALVPQKGFHVLAKVWPAVLKRVPDAKLTVIGSGALYDNTAKLGPLGIADGRYEKKHILPYLCDNKGKPLPSVHFAGKLGEEKKEILYRASIGVPNPTGITENCPGSALEFEACGTAVVSGAYWGMLDTIKHGVTGLLGKSEQDLTENICALLEDHNSALSLGKNGIDFVEQKYNWDRVVDDWENLFVTITSKKPIKRIPFKKNFMSHFKGLIMINRFFQISIGKAIYWPFIVEIKEKVYPKMAAMKTAIASKKHNNQ